jgi:hypothetical protein
MRPMRPGSQRPPPRATPAAPRAAPRTTRTSHTAPARPTATTAADALPASRRRPTGTGRGPAGPSADDPSTRVARPDRPDHRAGDVEVRRVPDHPVARIGRTLRGPALPDPPWVAPARGHECRTGGGWHCGAARAHGGLTWPRCSFLSRRQPCSPGRCEPSSKSCFTQPLMRAYRGEAHFPDPEGAGRWGPTTALRPCTSPSAS